MATKVRRACITGTFDVKNYGDLLFPLIAQWRLGEAVEIVPASPAGTPAGYPDACDPISIETLLCGEDGLDAVLIGGGEIVHNFRLFAAVEGYRNENITAWAHPSLWLGATLAAALRDLPVAWNAPGVPVPFPAAQRSGLMASTLRAADYVSVRDTGSAACLGAPDDVEVVPDTAVDIARMWPRDMLREPFLSLAARKGMAPETRYMAVHVRARSLGRTAPAELAEKIDAVSQAHEVTPMLIAIGPGVGDGETASAVARHLSGSHVLLDDPQSLKETAAAIAHAAVYVGASLHGAITAAAYDVPPVIVAHPPLHKIGGFLDHIGRRGSLARDWDAAFDTAAELLAGPAETWIPGTAFEAADRHWDRIAEAISQPSCKREARAAFLRDYTRLGIAKAGPAWGLGPFLRKVASARQRPPEPVGKP